MADLADDAQALEEAERQDGLAAVRGRVQHGDWARLSAEWCEDCGQAVPEARRRAVVGVRFCAECQSRVEREKRTRGW